MRKHLSILTTLSAVALVGLAAACSDAPTAASSITPGAPLRTAGVTVMVGDTTVTTFTVDPTSTDMFVDAGVFKLKMAANSICDPAVSTYGPGEWEKPCTTLVNTIQITARSWTTTSGRTMVKFSPDLRFSPSKTNMLYLWDKGATPTTVPQIGWCPTGSSVCVNEAASDPSVASTLGNNGFVSRRVKHFSGYTTTWGFDDSGSSGYGY